MKAPDYVRLYIIQLGRQVEDRLYSPHATCGAVSNGIAPVENIFTD